MAPAPRLARTTSKSKDVTIAKGNDENAPVAASKKTSSKADPEQNSEDAKEATEGVSEESVAAELVKKDGSEVDSSVPRDELAGEEELPAQENKPTAAKKGSKKPSKKEEQQKKPEEAETSDKEEKATTPAKKQLTPTRRGKKGAEEAIEEPKEVEQLQEEEEEQQTKMPAKKGGRGGRQPAKVQEKKAEEVTSAAVDEEALPEDISQKKATKGASVRKGRKAASESVASEDPAEEKDVETTELEEAEKEEEKAVPAPKRGASSSTKKAPAPSRTKASATAKKAAPIPEEKEEDMDTDEKEDEPAKKEAPGKKQPAAKRGTKKGAQPAEPDHESPEPVEKKLKKEEEKKPDDEPEEKKAKGRGRKAPAKKAEAEEDAEEKEEPAGRPRRAAVAATAAKKKAEEEEDNSSDSEIVKSKKKPAAKKGKAAPANKKKAEPVSEDDASDKEEEAGPSKDAAPKKGGRARKPPVAPAVKKGAAKKKQEDNDEEPAAKRRRGRSGGAVEVKEEENQEEEEEEDDTAEKAKSTKSIRRTVVKGKAAVDSLCSSMVDTAHVFEDGELIYDVMLNQTNVGNNNNKFYILQLLEKDSCNNFSVWFRWGRVGYDGQNKLEHFGTQLEKAKQVFAKKFFDKTRNEWPTSFEDFEPHPYKYTMIEMDYSPPTTSGNVEDAALKQEEEEAETKAVSKLDARVQSVIQSICNIREMQKAAIEMEYDAEKAPLGKLTKMQISEGYACLKRIETFITEKKFGPDFIRAVNEYYTKIPHACGFRPPELIKTPQKLKAELELLDLLQDIEIAIRALKSEKATDDVHPIDRHYASLKCELAPLEEDSTEKKIVLEYLANTHASTHCMKMKPLNVFKLEREGESSCDDVIKEIGNRRLLWHGSRLSNFFGILSQGLRIAPPEAPVTGYMFGKGVYFADMASKSGNYCYPTNKQRGFLILAEVALGASAKKLRADPNANKLPKDKKSTWGVGRTCPDPANVKTILDGVEVPCGLPVSNPTPEAKNCSLLYNEFIVYDTRQFRLRYLVEVEFSI